MYIVRDRNIFISVCLRLVIWQDFLAFVMWKKPYSHFLLTVFSQCCSFCWWMRKSWFSYQVHFILVTLSFQILVRNSTTQLTLQLTLNPFQTEIGHSEISKFGIYQSYRKESFNSTLISERPMINLHKIWSDLIIIIFMTRQIQIQRRNAHIVKSRKINR